MVKRVSGKAASTGGKKRFSYKKRASTQWETNASAAQGGSKDTWLKDQGFSMITVQEGSNIFRIMPPAPEWQDYGHYGIRVFAHYGIGPDNSSFLCVEALAKDASFQSLGLTLPSDVCPICEERRRAQNDGDEDYIKELRATKRIVAWAIDRNAEGKGPQLWAIPSTVDSEICSRAIDKRTREVYSVDDPEEGYDVEFEKTGKGLNTRYKGVEIGRRSEPLSDDEDTMDEWLEFICENSLPDLLVFHDYEYISKVFGGGAGGSASTPVVEEEEEETRPPRRLARAKTEEPEPEPEAAAEEEVPWKEEEAAAEPEPEPEPEPEQEEGEELTWKDIHAMGFEELEGLIEEAGLEIDADMYEDSDELADEVCDQAGIQKPQPTAKRAGLKRLKAKG